MCAGCMRTNHDVIQTLTVADVTPADTGLTSSSHIYSSCVRNSSIDHAVRLVAWRSKNRLVVTLATLHFLNSHNVYVMHEYSPSMNDIF